MLSHEPHQSIQAKRKVDERDTSTLTLLELPKRTQAPRPNASVENAPTLADSVSRMNSVWLHARARKYMTVHTSRTPRLFSFAHPLPCLSRVRILSCSSL